MPGSTSESPSCACGQVVFDVAGRKAGEMLSCPWCSKKYRYLGGNTIVPAAEAEEKEEGQDKGVAEAEAPETGAAPGERMKAHAARRKQQQAEGQELKPGQGSDSPKVKAGGRRPEIPGGALRMVAFIVVCNGIALLLLQAFFPPRRDGTRMTPWGWTLPRYKVPWPELVTLAIGHLCSFVAWAGSLYLLHRNQKRKAVEQVARPAEKKDQNEKQS